MRTIYLFLVIVVVMGLQSSCSAQTSQDKGADTLKQSSEVTVYYFHFSRRCATCQAVEDVTKEAVKEFYGDKVTFAGYNLDDENGEAMGKELKVRGQTLLIVSGDNRIDLTDEGFMNARTNPEKLKEIIKEKIDPLL
ncbi:MAG TPA: nitrophenyl compound nitroreductase subunit ArsF family protein [Bacteroidales bacterium]|nr:nitrophenyl compound nitroreductase subunit ArsF family protein [Bacteroidales bacterium]HRX98459.1 nitrophenyl compound nitroreductase subunit ArsF family protein [Bacteroidales bacterium]